MATQTSLEIRRPQQVQRSGAAFLTPHNFGEALQFAKALAGSDLVPKDYRGKPENVLVALQMGAEVGLAPMQALKWIAVINGRAGLWGDGALAVVMQHPDFEGIKEDDVAAIDKSGAARCTVKRRGCEPHTETYTVELAKKAHLWGKQGPWTDHPARMLQMRARAWCLRNTFPDALSGLGIGEELADTPADSGVTVVDFTPEVTIERVLSAVAAAEDETSLAAVTAAAMQLGPDDQKRAREAYKARLVELRKTAQPPAEGKREVKRAEPKQAAQAPAEPEPEIDPKTGEVLGHAEQPPAAAGEQTDLGW